MQAVEVRREPARNRESARKYAVVVIAAGRRHQNGLDHRLSIGAAFEPTLLQTAAARQNRRILQPSLEPGRAIAAAGADWDAGRGSRNGG
jgi:hypothetical protein